MPYNGLMSVDNYYAKNLIKTKLWYQYYMYRSLSALIAEFFFLFLKIVNLK